MHYRNLDLHSNLKFKDKVITFFSLIKVKIELLYIGFIFLYETPYNSNQYKNKQFDKSLRTQAINNQLQRPMIIL